MSLEVANFLMAVLYEMSGKDRIPVSEDKFHQVIRSANRREIMDIPDPDEPEFQEALDILLTMKVIDFNEEGQIVLTGVGYIFAPSAMELPEDFFESTELVTNAP